VNEEALAHWGLLCQKQKLLPNVIMMQNCYSALIKYKFYNIINNFLLI